LKIPISLLILFLIFISCDLFKTKKSENLSLTKTRWELISFNYSYRFPIHVSPGQFTLLFSDTFTVDSKVDCNQCFGEFILGDRNSISIQLQACTEVACFESKDNEFHEAIRTTTRYTIHKNRLRLYFDHNFLYFLSKPD
jgi:heat shock protein HslJ